MGYTLEEITKKIKDLIGHDVVSKEFINTKLPLDIKCTCGVIYQKDYKAIKVGYYHCNGKKHIAKRVTIKEINCINPNCNKIFKPQNNKQKFCSMFCSSHTIQTKEYMMNNGLEKQYEKQHNKKLKSKICEFCKDEFQPKQSCIKFCSINCIHSHQKTNTEYKEQAKLNGQKGGKQSAHSQQRRSKNEVMFAELCEDHFGKDDVLCNEPIFDGWDADVIILGKKIAVMWNGKWHYHQIMHSQSLVQVQTRDRIKTSIIIKYGYTPYVIKDLGKHNPKFVLQEFQCFLFSLIDG